MPSKVLSETLWTELYRPSELADVALDPDNRQVLESFLGNEIPHLLLLGPAGSGKTTVARILMHSLDCSVLALNASAERGIDTVRQKIGSFVTAITGARWNIVFLDEFDHMTSDAQTALRNLIESYADRARFLLTGNYGHKIIAPIQSRCQTLTLARPPLKERFRVLKKVLDAEGIESTIPIIMGYAEKFPDMRAMLFAAQRGYLKTGRKSLPVAASEGAHSGDDLFQWLVARNYVAFRQVTTSGEFDALQQLRDLFHAIPDDHSRAGMLREVIGRGVHETGFSPDPVVLFLAVVAQAMNGL